MEFIWKLPGPLAEQVRRLSEQVGGMEVMSASDYETNGPPQMTTAPTAGTGGYEFDSRRQTVGIVFKRVEYDHWRHNPDFAELEIRWMNEESTRLAALLTDEIHVTQLGADSTELASGDGMLVETGTLPGARIFGAFQGGYLDITDRNYEAQGTTCQYVHCDSPFLNPLVRKAMNKASRQGRLEHGLLPRRGPDNVHPGHTGHQRGFQPRVGGGLRGRSTATTPRRPALF